MITAYHRPESLEEALRLLARPVPETIPLGGGTSLARVKSEDFEVVDLQALGLGQITVRGNFLEMGAMVRLQTLVESEAISDALRRAIRHEAPLNLRNMATVAGTLVAADGRSPFAAVMLALDAQLTLVGGQPPALSDVAEPALNSAEGSAVSLGELLLLREDLLPGALITHITIPLNVSLAYEYIARTPADLPIVCAAVAGWPSGRTRVVLGGYGASPLLAMDGPTPDGAQIAARDAYSEAGDEIASAGYRSEMAAVLVRRCLER